MPPSARADRFAPCLDAALTAAPQAGTEATQATPLGAGASTASAADASPQAVGTAGNLLPLPACGKPLPALGVKTVAVRTQDAPSGADARPARKQGENVEPSQGPSAMAAPDPALPIPACAPAPEPLRAPSQDPDLPDPLAVPAGGAAPRAPRPDPAAALPAGRMDATAATGEAANGARPSPTAPFVPPEPAVTKAQAAVEPAITTSVAALTAQAPAPPAPARAHATDEATPSSYVAPTAQVAPALVALGTGAQSGRLTVQLQPEELGRVRIQIDRPLDGPASVQVTAERPETMALLARDASSLHRTLDQAGVPSEGRTLTFQLAPEEAPAAVQAAPAASGGDRPDLGMGGDANAGGGGGPGGQGANGGANHGNGGRSDSAWAWEPSPSGAPTRWVAAGLDITA